MPQHRTVRWQGLAAIVDSLEVRQLLSATLFEDTNADRVVDLLTNDFAELNGRAFVLVETRAGVELWSSDGTPKGTSRVERIASPGGCMSGQEEMVAAGGRVYFTCEEYRAQKGTTLWTSNGTAKGTYAVRTVPTGGITDLHEGAGKLLFTVGRGSVQRQQFWFSDGTRSGTGRVGGDRYFSDLVAVTVGDLAVYSTGEETERAAGASLHMTDGRSAGNRRIAVARGERPVYASPIASLDGRLIYFTASESSGVGIWRAEPALERHRLLGRLPAPADLDYMRAGRSVVVDGRLFFGFDDGRRGPELWMTDGTRRGTSIVLDSQPDPVKKVGHPHTGIDGLATVGGSIFFVQGESLWRVNAAGEGATLLRRHVTGELAVLSGGLMYNHPGSSGLEWWRVDVGPDGVPRGHQRVLDGDSTDGDGAFGLGHFARVALPGHVVFVGEDRDGWGLFSHDGTRRGARLLCRFDYRTDSSAPTAAAVVRTEGEGETLLFGTRNELRIRGTSDGRSEVVRTFRQGYVHAIQSAPPGAPTGVKAIVTVVYPTADATMSPAPIELWATDGTAQGTRRLDRASGPGEWLGDRYFFTSKWNPYAAPTGASLSVSDGTRSGTRLIKGLPPALAGASLESVGVAAGRLWLIAAKEQKSQLWVLDPAGGNARQLPATPTYGSSFAAVGDRVFFSAGDPEHGQELWSSDGRPEGTALVKDINPGPGDSEPRELTSVGQAVFFRATDAEHGSELWRSAGSAATTALVKDIAPGFRDSRPSQLAALGDALYFAAGDLTHGSELWRSDGTGAGTTLVKDINPGPAGSLFEEPFLLAAGRLFLVADDGAHGLEYWVSDGTAAGTALLADINRGPEGGADRFGGFGTYLNIEAATLFNDAMLVPANDGTHGSEFYRIDLGG